MLHKTSFGSFWRACSTLLNKNINKKRGFTLSEVLIALAIIAVIIVLIMPVVTTRMQNKSFALTYQTEVKQMLSSLEGLPASENRDSITETMMYVKDEHDPEDYGENAGKYVNKYMKVVKYCGNEPGDCFANVYYEYKDNDKVEFDTTGIRGACAILKNGVSICIKPMIKRASGRERITGWIDLNGPKEPNIYGRDLRTFSIDLKHNAVFSDEEPTTIITPDPATPCEGDNCPEDPPTPCEISDVSKACCDSREIVVGDPCCKWYINDPTSPAYETCNSTDCPDDDPECNVNVCENHTISSSDDDCCKIEEIKEVTVACCKPSDINDLCCRYTTNAACCLYRASKDITSLKKGSACCELAEVQAKYPKICNEINVCEENENSEQCCTTEDRKEKIEGPYDECCTFESINSQLTQCCRKAESNGDTCCKWKKDNNAFVADDACCGNKNYGFPKDSSLADKCCSAGELYGEDKLDEICCTHLVGTDYSKLESGQLLHRCCVYGDYKKRPECCSSTDGQTEAGDNLAACCKADASSPSEFCCFSSDITWDSNRTNTCCNFTDKNTNTTWQANCCSKGSTNYPSANKYKDNCCTSSDKWFGDCCALKYNKNSNNDAVWIAKCCGEDSYKTTSQCCKANWIDGCCDANKNSMKNDATWQTHCCSLGKTNYPSTDAFRSNCCTDGKLNTGGKESDAQYCCDPRDPTKGTNCCKIFEDRDWKDFDGTPLTKEAKASCGNYDDYTCAERADLPNSSDWNLPECCSDSTMTNKRKNDPFWKSQCCGVERVFSNDDDFVMYCCANDSHKSLAEGNPEDARCCRKRAKLGNRWVNTWIRNSFCCEHVGGSDSSKISFVCSCEDAATMHHVVTSVNAVSCCTNSTVLNKINPNNCTTLNPGRADLGTIWDVIGTCNRADAVEIGGQTYIAEKVIPGGSVVPVNPGGGEPVLIQNCDTTLQTDWQNNCCASALTSTDTTVVEVFPTMCCKKLKEKNSNYTNRTAWKNKCCSVDNNGLNESEMSKCCLDTNGNLYGGGHNDVCCTNYTAGSACCRDNGTTVNGGNNASCCKWAGLPATGISASNYCCENTNINNLSNPLNWRNGCCMKSTTYKYNETLGCCSWRLTSNHFESKDNCCSAISGTYANHSRAIYKNRWRINCCSKTNNGLSDDLFKSYCCADEDGHVVGGEDSYTDSRCVVAPAVDCDTALNDSSVTVLPSECCSQIQKTHPNMSKTKWKNACCSSPDIDLTQSQIRYYCCSDTHGSLYGGGHNDVCCTDYQPGSVCCSSSSGIDSNGNFQLGCCIWDGLADNGKSATDDCCAYYGYTYENDSWHSGCCDKNDYKHIEQSSYSEVKKCCSWRYNKRISTGNSAYFPDNDACCSNTTFKNAHKNETSYKNWCSADPCPDGVDNTQECCVYPYNWNYSSSTCCSSSNGYNYNGQEDENCCTSYTGYTCCSFKNPWTSVTPLTNYDAEPCCSSGVKEGTNWLNSCCSKQYISSATGHTGYSNPSGDFAQCCLRIYAQDNSYFGTQPDCCTALGIGDDGRRSGDSTYYADCANKCAVASTYGNGDVPYNYNSTAKQCCDDKVGLADSNWYTYCCGMKAPSGDQWQYRGATYYQASNSKCCPIRKTSTRVWAYVPSYMNSACNNAVGIVDKCSSYYDPAKGFYCGETDACMNWANGGSAPSNDDDKRNCCKNNDTIYQQNKETCCGFSAVFNLHKGDCCNYSSIYNNNTFRNSCCEYWGTSTVNGDSAKKSACCADSTYSGNHQDICDPCASYRSANGEFSCTQANGSNQLLCNISGYSPSDTFYVYVDGSQKLTFPKNSNSNTNVAITGATLSTHTVQIRRGTTEVIASGTVDFCRGIRGQFIYDNCTPRSGYTQIIQQGVSSICDPCSIVSPDNATETCCNQWTQQQLNNNLSAGAQCCNYPAFKSSHLGYCCGSAPSTVTADATCCEYWHNNYCAWSSSNPSACIRANIGIHTWTGGNPSAGPAQQACCSNTAFFSYLQQHSSEYSNNSSRLFCCDNGASCSNTKVDSLTLHVASTPTNARQVAVTYRNECNSNDVYNYRIKIMHTCTANGYEACPNGICTRYINGLPKGTNVNCSNGGKIFFVALEYCPNGNFNNCSQRKARGTTSYSSNVQDVGSFSETLNLGACGN